MVPLLFMESWWYEFEFGREELIFVSISAAADLDGRGLRVLMGTVLLTWDEARGFNMGIWKDNESNSWSS